MWNLKKRVEALERINKCKNNLHDWEINEPSYQHWSVNCTHCGKQHPFLQDTRLAEYVRKLDESSSSVSNQGGLDAVQNKG